MEEDLSIYKERIKSVMNKPAINKQDIKDNFKYSFGDSTKK